MATETNTSSGEQAHKHPVGKSKSPRAAHGPNGSSRSHRAANHTNRAAGLLAVQDTASNAIDSVARQLVDFKKKSIESTAAVENTIIGNPKASVAIAFGVGYILARLRRWM